MGATPMSGTIRRNSMLTPMCKCDKCNMTVSDKSKVIGWVSLTGIDGIVVSIKNTSFEGLGAVRLKSIENGDLDFCSTKCLIDYFVEATA
jgi:hypothetical protein